MNKFKNEIIPCTKCRKANFVKVKDFEAGYFKCSQCSHVNATSTFAYNEQIIEKLPHVGFLISVKDPSEKYALRPGKNVLGVGEMADIILNRITHNGKCFISRRHCTLTVSFDKRNGWLNYLLEDGAVDTGTGESKASLNSTFYKGKKLDQQDAVYIEDQELINLGGEDVYRLEQYSIPSGTLEGYKISQRIDDGTTT